MNKKIKFSPKYCPALIEHMKHGYSFHSFASVVEVPVETLNKWSKEHVNFNEAKEIGESCCLYWWEKMGLRALHKIPGEPVIDAQLWIFNMENRFPKLWGNPTVHEEPKELSVKLAYARNR